MKRSFGVSSGVGVLVLLLSANVFAQAKQPLTTATRDDLAAGQRVFDAQCGLCHGREGTGAMGPNLQRATLRHAASDEALIELVRNGIPGTEMPAFVFSMTERSAWQTAAYVRSLGRVAQSPIPGDPQRGAARYESSGCAGCHT